MTGEWRLEKILGDEVVPKLRTSEAEENHKIPQNGHPMSWPRFKPSP